MNGQAYAGHCKQQIAAHDRRQRLLQCAVVVFGKTRQMGLPALFGILRQGVRRTQLPVQLIGRAAQALLVHGRQALALGSRKASICARISAGEACGDCTANRMPHRPRT